MKGIIWLLGLCVALNNGLRLTGNEVGTTDSVVYASGSYGSGRIVNGMKALPGQFPWQVGIFYTIENNTFFCGGALISNQWVLTAAHCVYNATDIRVMLGTTKALTNDSDQVVMGISKAISHPDYNKPNNINNDVAVIQLDDSVEFTKNIKSIRLPADGEELEDDTEVIVSGWGKISDETNDIVNDLNYVKLTTISNSECEESYVGGLITDNVVCCEGTDHKSPCSGDSGGPLIQKYDGNWTSVGVASFVSSKGCEKNQPSGFSRTESYLGFIYANTDLTPSEYLTL